MSTEMVPVTWGMSLEELEAWASGASDGQQKSPEDIQRQETLCRAYQQRLDEEALAERELALDETKQASLANTRSQNAQLQWVHEHSGRNKDGSFWGFRPNPADGERIRQTAVQQWAAAGNVEPLTELTYDRIDRAASFLYESGQLEGWRDDGIHSIHARFVRTQEPAPEMSEQQKEEKREWIRKIQEDQAYSLPLEKVKEIANRQLAEQAAGQPDHGSMWGDRSQRGPQSNMPLNPGWRPASLDGTLEPSEE